MAWLLTGISIGVSAGADPGLAPGDLVLRYLRQDVFLSPGNGFQRVRIGHSFRHVAREWGQPKQKLGRGWGGKNKWLYEAGDKTVLLVSGTDRIQSISVIGAPNSLYQSVEGARFGMTPQQVTRLYPGSGPPGQHKVLSYRRLGIEFTFANRKLKAMRVFAPGGR